MIAIKNKYAMLAVSTAVCMFFACGNSSDYKNYNDSTATQTPVAAPTNADSTALTSGDSVGPVKDTSTGYAGGTDLTASKKTTASHNPAKKGHKGHARMAVYSPDYRAKMEQDKEGIYNYAEEKPMFPGGEKALDKFIEENIHYPQNAMDNGVEGTVIVTFAVDDKGKVFSPKLKDDKLGYGLDEEALGTVAKMPKWTPGRVKGKNVKTYYDLPITFTLAD
jgi:TonB family protein